MLVKYADNCTTELLEDQTLEKVIIIIPCKLLPKVGKIIADVEKKRLSLVACKSLFLHQVISCIEDEDFELKFELPNKASDCGAEIVLAFQGKNSINIIQDMSENWEAIYGKIICVGTKEGVQQAFDLLLNSVHNTIAQFIDGRSTCCVIKPHIIKSYQSGNLIEKITTMKDEMYEISAMQLFYLDHDTSSDFFSVYYKIINGWKEMVEHCSGPIIALEVLQKEHIKDNDAVTNFRKLIAGPYDVDIAKELFPLSIRATFGVNNVQNAIHCTDLSEDGVAEVRYFFQLMAGLGREQLDVE